MKGERTGLGVSTIKIITKKRSFTLGFKPNTSPHWMLFDRQQIIGTRPSHSFAVSTDEQQRIKRAYFLFLLSGVVAELNIIGCR